jgi:hypothetical protein
VKFTTIFSTGQFCPKDAQKRCACTRLHDRFEVISDLETIEQADTDTGRIARAGALQVLWCLAREGAHAEAWEHVKELVPADSEIVTEGNTALLSIPTDALIFLVNPSMPRRYWKSNWKPLAERAHAVVVNDAPQAIGRRKPAPPEERAASLAEVLAAAPLALRVTGHLDTPWHAWGSPLDRLVAPEKGSGINSLRRS